MVRFLFWNLNKQKFGALLRSAVDLHEIDVLVLAENPWRLGEILPILNEGNPRLFYATRGHCPRILIFVRFLPAYLHPVFESASVSARLLRLPERQELILVALHLPSKLHASEESLSFEASVIASDIRRVEEKQCHRRTVVVGDFNLNPFEPGLVGAASFHAVSSQDVASRGERTVQGRAYPFFYNPMWNFLGDFGGSAPGSFYYENSEHVSHFWHTLDQVLLRPELAAGFGRENLQILTSIGEESLVDRRGRPNAADLSDHLPVFFQIEF